MLVRVQLTVVFMGARAEWRGLPIIGQPLFDGGKATKRPVYVGHGPERRRAALCLLICVVSGAGY